MKNIIALLLIFSTVSALAQISGPSVVCAGATGVAYSVTVSGGGIGVGSYVWVLNGKKTGSNSPNVSITIPSTGTSHSFGVTFFPTTGDPEGYSLPLTSYNVGTISSNLSSVCAGATVEFSVTGHNGANFSWEKNVNGGGWQSVGFGFPNPLADIVSANTAYRLVLTTSANGGCGTLYSNTVNVTGNPIPGLPGVTGASRCGTGTVVLGASTGSNGNQVRWYETSSSGTILSTDNNFTTPSLSSTTSYWVSTENTTTGCGSGRVQVTATINPIPGSPSVSNNAICGPGSVSLSGSPGSNANTLRWYDQSSGGTLLTTSTSYAPSLSSTTNYWVSSYNTSTSCESSRTQVTATINTVPSQASSSGAARCGTGTVFISASAGANGTTVRWYNASSGGTLLTTDLSYTTPSLSSSTNYWISTYHSGTVCESSRTMVTATINPVPSSPSTTNGSRCGSGSVSLSATVGANGNAVRWYDASSGGSLLATNTSYATPSIGSTTTFWASSYNSTTQCEGTRVAVTATVNPIPSSPSSGGAARCGTGTLLINATAGANGNTVRWYDASSGGTLLTTSLSYTTPSLSSTTNYWISTYNSTTGCEGSRTQITATINPIPASPSVSNSSRCGEGTVMLSGSSGADGTTLRWYNASSGGSLLATNTSYTTPSLTSSTNYWVSSYNATTQCEGTRVQVSAIVNAVPSVPSVDAVSRCGTGSVSLTAVPGSNGNSARWYTASSGGTLLSTGTGYSPSVLTTTTYYVSTYNTMTTCESPGRTSVIVTVFNPPPSPVATGYFSRYGFGSMTLEVSGAPTGALYRWTTASDVVIPGETGPTFTADFPTTTSYKAFIISTDGCSSTPTVITGNVVTIPIITATGDPYLTTGNSVTLSVPNVYNSYQWKRNGAVVGGATSYSITASTTGKYTVVVTDGNSVPYESDYSYVVELSNAPSETAPTLVTETPSSVSTASEKNYVRTFNARQPGLQPSDFSASSFNRTEVSMSTQYIDGIGMPVQVTEKEGSPTGKDMVVHLEYDVFARTPREYLPYATASTDIDTDGFRKNSKLEQYQFYRNGTTEVAVTGVPYTDQAFEASPLNRVLKKASPGEAWRMGSGHEVKIGYWALGSQDATVRHFTVDGVNLVQDGSTYAMRELSVVETRDENDHAVREYKDKEGRIVLRRMKSDDDEWLDTYYVYDDAANLRFVIPPLLNKRAYPFAQSSIDSLAFQYRHDERKRLIEQRVPGTGWVYMIYDNLDRIVLRQDAVQRQSNRWSFTKYDVLGRPLMTGEYTDATSYGTLRTSISAQNSYESKDGSQEYTLTTALPSVVSADVYTKTFYDNYALPSPFNIGTTHAFVAQTGFSSAYNRRVRGQVTATMVRNLDTQQWLEAVTYYDDRYRPIMTIARNARQNLDKVFILYENVVSPEVLHTLTIHNAGTASEILLSDKAEYDDAGRVMKLNHNVNNASTDVTLANNRYNEISQLVEKTLHASWFQQVNMSYNIRGHLTSINDASLTTDPRDLFGMELFYEGGYQQNQYNGNISGVQWKNAQDGSERSYGFVYDPLNRLRMAEHRRNTDVIPTSWSLETGRYNEHVTGYDANGNIRGLIRGGETNPTTHTFDVIDELLYTYSGNRLLKVVDTSAESAGFKDDAAGQTDSSDDYGYDANGSAVKDENKDISLIEYNHLSLPKKVTKGSGEYVKYIYDALGQKLRQEVYDDSDVLQKSTDYAGAFIYENDTLRFINHAEGRVIMTGSVPEYQYHLRDHLGNVRLTATTKAEVDSYSANFESATNTDFTAYTRTNFDLFDHTDAGTTYSYAQMLNGGYNGQVGLAKSFAVQPGDTIKAQVYAKYFGTEGSAGNIAAFATALLGAFNLPTPGGSETGTASSALNSFGALVAGGDGHDIDESDPKGYLNILVFDKNYNLLDVAYEQIDAAYVQTGSTKMPHQLLSRTVAIKQAGFVFVYLSNEGANQQDIYFDDAEYQHIKSPIVQADEYYPFGLQVADLSYQRSASKENTYLYNGKEKQDELDLGWLDYGARMYDNTIGRWLVVDPLAEKMRRWTPYNYAFNNPVRFIDPDGMEAVASGNGTPPPMEETPDLDFDEMVDTGYGQMVKRKNLTGSVDIYNFSSFSYTDEGDPNDPSAPATQNNAAEVDENQVQDQARWYYARQEGIINGHAFAWDKENNIVFEINYPPAESSAKAMVYKWNLNDETEVEKFWKFDGGRPRVHLAPVNVPNPDKTYEFFDKLVGKRWPYELTSNNCKDFAEKGFRKGGAILLETGPQPSAWQPLSSFTIHWKNPYWGKKL
jgi:RHS repeat-associated protein